MVVIREHVRDGVISDYLLKTRLAIRQAGWHEIDVLIWSKPDAPPTGRPDRPRRAFEYVLWYSATPKPFAEIQDEKILLLSLLNPIYASEASYLRSQRRSGGTPRVVESNDVLIMTQTAL